MAPANELTDLNLFLLYLNRKSAPLDRGVTEPKLELS